MGGGAVESGSGSSSSGSQGATLWALLSNELGLTFDQEEKLKQKFLAMETEGTRRDRRHLAVSVRYLRMLNDAVATIMEKVQAQTNTLMQILTPEQNVIFLSWMEENRAAMRARGSTRFSQASKG